MLRHGPVLAVRSRPSPFQPADAVQSADGRVKGPMPWAEEGKKVAPCSIFMCAKVTRSWLVATVMVGARTTEETSSSYRPNRPGWGRDSTVFCHLTDLEADSPFFNRGGGLQMAERRRVCNRNDIPERHGRSGPGSDDPKPRRRRERRSQFAQGDNPGCTRLM